jgi:thioredoxin 1
MEVLCHRSVGDAAQGSSLTVVVFVARWCLPSQNLVRSLQKIEGTFPLNVQVIDVEQNPELAARFGVRGIPTTMVVKDGAVEATRLGDLPLRRLTEWVDELV